MKSAPRRVSPLVKIAVFIHLLFIFCWSMPETPMAVRNGREKAKGSDILLELNEKYVKTNPIKHLVPDKLWPPRAYVLFTGTWQYWDMFSPNPANRDIWGDAVVVREDGSEERFEYPRMYKLPIPQKYVSERYRKFFERVSQDNFSYLWPNFGQRIALKVDHHPHNRPVLVRLYRHTMQVPKLGEPLPKSYETVLFYEHVVDRQLLDLAKTW